MPQKRQKIILAVALGIFLTGAILYSPHRPIDGDEGYYCTAARLVSEGRVPYLDFFYPQMPLLPYLYAPAYMVVGSSLEGMRLFSILLMALGLLFWGLFLLRHLRDRPWMFLVGLVLVGTNPYYLSWSLTVKTYALANTGVFFVMWALDRGLTRPRARWFLAAGLGAGLTTAARLLYLPWSVALAILLMFPTIHGGQQKPGGGAARRRTGFFALGMLLVAAPVLFLASRDPAAFWFNNLQYHRLRFSPLASDSELIHAFIALKTLFMTVITSPHLLLQLLLAGFGCRSCLRRGNGVLGPLVVFAAVGSIVHTFVCLIPDPVYPQYFTSPLAPLLAPLVVAGIIELEVLVRNRGLRLAAWISRGVLALALLLTVIDLQVLKTGMNQAQVWTFDNLHRMSTAIEMITQPQDTVLAFWSGYVFESGRRYVPGMENHFAPGVSEKLSQAEKIHFHIAGEEALRETITTATPRIVIKGAWMNEVNSTFKQEDIEKLSHEIFRRYRTIFVLGDARILVRRPQPLSSP